MGDGEWLVHNTGKCTVIQTAKGPIRSTMNKGDTKLFIKRNWDAATFNSELDSAAYHINKHAPDMTIQEYTEEAQKFYRSHWRMAEEVPYIKDPSIIVHRIQGVDGFGIFTKDGRVISYEPKFR